MTDESTRPTSNVSLSPQPAAAGDGDTPANKLSLPPGVPLVPALVAAFRQVLDYAISVADTVDEDPVRAVHEYRKSVRRARSVLRMLRPAVPGKERKPVREALRDLMRPTSILRDADVLVTTCEELALTGAAGEALAVVGDQVLAHRDALRAEGRARAILDEGAARLPDLVEALERSVRADTPAEDLVAAFHRTFRRAERSRERALDRRTDKATHDWRKRVKELRYQLEMLVEPDGSGPVDGLRRVYAALATRLGAITDVIALRHYIAAHSRDLSPANAQLLDASLEAHVDAARRNAADVIVEVRERIPILAVHGVESPTPPEDAEGEAPI